jgi:hypothetical protein
LVRIGEEVVIKLLHDGREESGKRASRDESG